MSVLITFSFDKAVERYSVPATITRTTVRDYMAYLDKSIAKLSNNHGVIYRLRYVTNKHGRIAVRYNAFTIAVDGSIHLIPRLDVLVKLPIKTSVSYAVLRDCLRPYHWSSTTVQPIYPNRVMAALSVNY